MAIFDIQSGTQSASAFSFNPYAAAAAFVIGGFAGGSAKARAQKRAKKLRKKLRRFATPEFLSELVGRSTALNRTQLLASGVGQRTREATLSALSNLGLVGTGQGVAGLAAAEGAIDLEGFRQASLDAPRLQNLAITTEAGIAPVVEAARGGDFRDTAKFLSEVAAAFDLQQKPTAPGSPDSEASIFGPGGIFDFTRKSPTAPGGSLAPGIGG